MNDESAASVENLAETKTHTYFSDVLMQARLSRAHDAVSNLVEKSQTERAITEQYKALVFVRVALHEMTQIPALFDLSCDFNIKTIGSVFAEHVQAVGSNERHDIDTLFAGCYRFVVEFELKSENGLPGGLSSAWNDISDLNFLEFKIASEQIKWARSHMVFSMFREYIHHPHMIGLKNLPAAIQASDEAISKSNEELSLREARVIALADKLKGYENAYNFVGLFQGFSNLRENKDSEKSLAFKFLVALGLCMVLVPLLKVFGIIGHSEDLVREIFSVAALLALELMLIYFFRITLQNFRSIKSQMLQIDLRMTLCQFINSYVEFASDARKTDKELLTRFEQVIFSGIVAEDSLIPSTFDGLEQVAKIVDSLKSK